MRTIWSKGALDDVPERYRPLGHVVYPLIYGFFILIFGAYGTVKGGSANVAAVTLEIPWYSHVLCALVGLSAVLSFVGIVFGKKRLELIGAGGLAIFATMYLILLFIALGTGNGAPIAATTTTGVVIFLLGFRYYDLLNEIEKRKTARASQ